MTTTDDAVDRREQRRARRRRRKGFATEPEMPALPPPDPDLIADLVQRHGLHPVGRRSNPWQYLMEVLDRRHFITALARAQMRSENSKSRLGQLWVVLNPLFNAAVFYLIFGVVLQTSRGIDNFVAFLVIGVFTMGFSTGSLAGGAKSIISNMNLLRAFSFPRMVMPLTVLVQQFLEFLVAIAVMLCIVLATGEPLTVYWLALPVVIGMQTLFNVGIGLIVARISSDVPDIQNALPFFSRAWTYMSGVFFSIDRFASRAPDGIRFLFEINPGNIYMSLMRDVLMQSYTAPQWYWWVALAWGVGMLLLGYFLFWANEERYGRG